VGMKEEQYRRIIFVLSIVLKFSGIGSKKRIARR